MRRELSCCVRAATFAGICAAILTGCGKRAETPPSPAPPIAQQAPLAATNAATPVQPPVSETLLLPETVAELQGSAETPVVAKEAGYVVRQMVKESAIVAAGDPLFLVDPRPSHDGAATSAQINAGLVKIVAPIAGDMGRPLHAAGDWINAGDALVTIAKIDPIRAVFSMPKESALARQAFVLTLDDGSAYPAKGELESLNAADTKITIRLTFPNSGSLLRPGQFVKVRGIAP